jgi:hypothetical protein
MKEESTTKKLKVELCFDIKLNFWDSQHYSGGGGNHTTVSNNEISIFLT